MPVFCADEGNWCVFRILYDMCNHRCKDGISFTIHSITNRLLQSYQVFGGVVCTTQYLHINRAEMIERNYEKNVSYLKHGEKTSDESRASNTQVRLCSAHALNVHNQLDQIK